MGGDAALGHPDELYRLCCGHREGKTVRVGVADVLGGKDHEPPGHEHGVLPGLEHPRQVVQRRVGVAAAHALYERAYDVVVLLAPVAERPLPHRPLHVSRLDPPRAGRRDL